MQIKAHKLRVVAFSELTSAPGFALPLCKEAQHASTWILQEVDRFSDQVENFKTLEDNDVRFTEIDDGPFCEIGKPPVYVFVTEANNVHVGSLSTLSAELRDFAVRCPDNIAVRVQIAELIGTREEQTTAYNEMFEKIRSLTGHVAARRFYEGSVLQSALWSCLISSASSSEAADRIWSRRSLVSARLGDSGEILVDIALVASADIGNIKSAEVESHLTKEFSGQIPQSLMLSPRLELSRTTVRMETPSLEGNRLKSSWNPLVTEVVGRILKAKKQEERLAILLDVIFADRAAGRDVLRIYSTDKAKYAAFAIHQISKMISVAPDLLGNDDFPTNVSLARTVHQIFSSGMPANRVLLLFYMARHLAKYPEVNKFLREKLNITTTNYIATARDDISGFLTTPIDHDPSLKNLLLQAQKAKKE